MKELVIAQPQEGQRLDTYLTRILPGASRSFLYKMLRKKNITLNAKKAAGNEKLKSGDVVRIWFSEETFSSFAGGNGKEASQTFPRGSLEILYEDDQVLLINKPAGMLTQKAEAGDVSLNEYLIGYLLETRQTDLEKLRVVKPSVCNRLDRNTSGIVAAGKTIPALQALSALFRERTMEKWYRCIVMGHAGEGSHLLEGYLEKDPRTNQVRIRSQEGQGARILTRYRVRFATSSFSELDVELITGRSHQIRAHLASISHPIIGDQKYGDTKANRLARERWGVTGQLLHACRLSFPGELPQALTGLAGRTIEAPLPGVYARALEEITPNRG